MSDADQSADIRALVGQLLDPQTRRIARQKLVAARAVDALLQCLTSTNESIVWAAVQSLEEMRATDAVGPLVELMSKGVLVVDVAEALTKITGQKFGGDLAGWQKWVGDSGHSAAAELDVDQCIAHTAEYLGVKPSGSGDSYRFKVTLPDDRSQKVAVFFGRQDTAGDKLVVIYSECGPANPRHYETLLRKNMTIPAGAFAVRDVKKEPTLVMVDTMIADLITPSALAKKIENIAALADSVEKSLTNEDKR